jgi:alpha-glucoside transport system substrate-binding protein
MLGLLLLPAVALPFAACGDDDETEETVTSTATEGGSPAGTSTTTSEPSGDIGEVDVMAVWSDEEEEGFRAMVAPWEEETGGSMTYTGTRDLTQQVRIRVEGGNDPDVVIAPEIGVLQELVADGKVVPLSQCEGLDDYVRENYPEAYVNLASVDGEVYGVIMKVDNKGTIFYNPALFEENGWEPLTADSSFDDLVALAEEIAATGTPPFSLGIESAESTGWVITDWVAQILLAAEGLETYNGVVSGEVPFDDDAVRAAWEELGRIVHAEGFIAQDVPDGVLATTFQESTYLPYEDPPAAAMVYLGSFGAGFIETQFPDLVAGDDYDFMPFPGGAITGGFNVAYALNDSETSCSFLTHLAQADTQQIWVDIGGFNSAHREIDLSAYENAVARKAAEQLLEAEVFAGDLDDLVGGEWQATFWAGAIQYLGDPDSLDEVLSSIEAAR